MGDAHLKLRHLRLVQRLVDDGLGRMPRMPPSIGNSLPMMAGVLSTCASAACLAASTRRRRTLGHVFRAPARPIASPRQGRAACPSSRPGSGRWPCRRPAASPGLWPGRPRRPPPPLRRSARLARSRKEPGSAPGAGAGARPRRGLPGTPGAFTKSPSPTMIFSYIPLAPGTTCTPVASVAPGVP